MIRSPRATGGNSSVSIMAENEKLPPVTEYNDKYIPYPWMTLPGKEPVIENEKTQTEDYKVMSYSEAVRIVDGARCKGPKWPQKSEYFDKYDIPKRKTPVTKNVVTDKPIDMLTGRPRTPNDQYTVLTNTQLKNMKKDSTPFFSLEGPGKDTADAPLKRPAPIDRYAFNRSQYLYRDTPPKSHPHCFIDDQWQKEPPVDHNTSRLGATLRWGPSKTGERTISHFHKEDVHRYMTIDMYKRPPTNIPSTVVMKHGRPSEGYYQQRNPNFNTWFGSTHRLNETNVLTTIRPKSTAEYQDVKALEQADAQHRASKWPEVSEYTDKFLMNTQSFKPTSNLEKRKQKHREMRREAARSLLQDCSTPAQAQPMAV